MTDPSSPSPPIPSLEDLLRRSWTAFSSEPVPLGWLTHTVGQFTAYLNNPDRSHAVAAPQNPDATATSGIATSLHQRVHEQLFGLVSEGHLDVEHANATLDALGLPLLTRRWHVRIGLPIRIEVSATDQEDAFDTAEAVIETALQNAELPAHIEWDGRERDEATPGDLDTDPTDPPLPRRRRTSPSGQFRAHPPNDC